MEIILNCKELRISCFILLTVSAGSLEKYKFDCGKYHLDMDLCMQQRSSCSLQNPTAKKFLGFQNPTAKKFLLFYLLTTKMFLRLAGSKHSRPARRRKKLSVCRHKKKFLHVHYFGAVL